MTQRTRWNFAGFEIDTAAGILRKHGEPVKIGRQAFRALALLVSSGGEVVTRESLQKEIWGDRVHVDFEHGLNVCIRQVRLALADEAEASPIVVTCPREGYRLGVPVKPVAEPAWRGLRERLAAPDRSRRDIRLWGVAAAGLALVVAGAMLTSSFMLAPGSPSSVAGGESANPARQAAPAPVATVPSLQPVAFSRPWPTASSEAYAWYWRGRGYYDRASGRRPAWALPYFETAASLDPNFALAQASLTVSYLDRAATGVARTESLAKAKQAAVRAVTLGPQLAETHVALGELSYRLDGNIAHAEKEFVRALELDTRNPYARQRYAAFLHEQRRFEEALDQLRDAHDLDPLSVMTNWQTANELLYLRHYEAAIAQANHTLELDPSHSWSFRTIGQSLEEIGKREEAIAAYLKAGQVALGHLGRAYALSGRSGEARNLLASLSRQPVDGTGHNGVAIAFILTGLGEPAKAMQWLERTQRDGVRLPFSLRLAPQWDTVRASRSFTEFLKKNDVAGS